MCIYFSLGPLLVLSGWWEPEAGGHIPLGVWATADRGGGPARAHRAEEVEGAAGGGDKGGGRGGLHRPSQVIQKGQLI